jgi:AAA+ superfamily predicted ATPase
MQHGRSQFNGRVIMKTWFGGGDMIQNMVGGRDLRSKIAEHMGRDPAELQIVTEEFEAYNHPNLQLAINEFIAVAGRSAKLLGVQGGAVNFMGTGMSEIVAQRTLVNSVGFGGAKEGPVQYTNVEINTEDKLPCVNAGLYLINDSTKLTVLLRTANAMFGGGGPQLEVLAENRVAAEEFISFIRHAVSRVNIYRGRILSVSPPQGGIEGMRGATGLKFHSVPEVARDQIILPEGLLQRIERQTVAVGQYSEALKRAKRKLKRGILLHGKPGTGKTLTAMYLASAMKDRTVLVLTGRGLGLIESSAKLARWLAPSMVLIEDVDLIAEERSMSGACVQPMLFELLNQMDGLADDCDVLFVLTTNRPEILEPALASRPGRVDQAYEIPLPDSECRRRLFDLYFDGLGNEVRNLDTFIKRTSGASAAFIAELVRKAALFAAPEGDPIVVRDKHLDEAMHELLLIGGAVTKSLLGFSQIGFTAPEQPVRVNTIADLEQ